MTIWSLISLESFRKDSAPHTVSYGQFEDATALSMDIGLIMAAANQCAFVCFFNCHLFSTFTVFGPKQGNFPIYLENKYQTSLYAEIRIFLDNCKAPLILNGRASMLRHQTPPPTIIKCIR